MFFKDDNFQLRHEDELMLCCARTHVNEEINKKIISLASRDLDWEYLVNMASRHRFRPLLYINLNSICPEEVPEDVLGNLKSYYMANVQKNLMLTGELVKVIEILKFNDINAVPYKGPVLASLAYGNIGLREFGDIDIFIDKKNALKVKNAMISNEYELCPPIKIEDSFYMKFNAEYRFINKKTSNIIEIKWKFEDDFFSFPVNPQILLEELTKLDINLFQVHTFSPSNNLLIICIHCANHSWSRLSWICDISEFIQSENIDWDDVLEKSEKLGVKRILLINLILARDFFDLNFPNEILSHLNSDSSAKQISFQIKKRIFKKQFNIAERLILDIKKRENLKYGVKDCINGLITPSYADFLDIPLNEKLFPLYYMIRPVLLLKRYGKGPI